MNHLKNVNIRQSPVQNHPKASHCSGIQSKVPTVASNTINMTPCCSCDHFVSLFPSFTELEQACPLDTYQVCPAYSCFAFFFTVTNCNIFKVYYVIFLIYIYTVKCLPDQTTYRIYITSFSYCVYVVRTLKIYSLSKFQVYNTLLLIIVTILYVVGGSLAANACSTLVTLWTTTARPLCPWNFPGKHPGVGCHFFLQGIFPTQGLNLHLLHFRWILYC